MLVLASHPLSRKLFVRLAGAGRCILVVRKYLSVRGNEVLFSFNEFEQRKIAYTFHHLSKLVECALDKRSHGASKKSTINAYNAR